MPVTIDPQFGKLGFKQLAKNVSKKVILRLSQIAYDKSFEGSETHTKTGNLTRALYNSKRGDGRAVGVDPKIAPYGIYVLLGTRPHKIMPKEKKALRWPADGKFIFARTVNHPGYKGDNYLFAGGDEAFKSFNSIVEQAMREEK